MPTLALKRIFRKLVKRSLQRLKLPGLRRCRRDTTAPREVTNNYCPSVRKGPLTSSKGTTAKVVEGHQSSSLVTPQDNHHGNLSKLPGKAKQFAAKENKRSTPPTHVDVNGESTAKHKTHNLHSQMNLNLPENVVKHEPCQCDEEECLEQPLPAHMQTCNKAYHFVDQQASQEFICPICLDVICEQIQTTCCGKHLCGLCYQTMKLTTPAANCPFCRDPNFEGFPDKHFKRKVGALVIYCSNTPNGCKWQGQLEMLEEHLNNYCINTNDLPISPPPHKTRVTRNRSKRLRQQSRRTFTCPQNEKHKETSKLANAAGCLSGSSKVHNQKHKRKKQQQKSSLSFFQFPAHEKGAFHMIVHCLRVGGRRVKQKKRSNFRLHLSKHHHRAHGKVTISSKHALSRSKSFCKPASAKFPTRRMKLERGQSVSSQWQKRPAIATPESPVDGGTTSKIKSQSTQSSSSPSPPQSHGHRPSSHKSANGKQSTGACGDGGENPDDNNNGRMKLKSQCEEDGYVPENNNSKTGSEEPSDYEDAKGAHLENSEHQHEGTSDSTRRTFDKSHSTDAEFPEEQQEIPSDFKEGKGDMICKDTTSVCVPGSLGVSKEIERSPADEPRTGIHSSQHHTSKKSESRKQHDPRSPKEKGPKSHDCLETRTPPISLGREKPNNQYKSQRHCQMTSTKTIPQKTGGNTSNSTSYSQGSQTHVQNHQACSHQSSIDTPSGEEQGKGACGGGDDEDQDGNGRRLKSQCEDDCHAPNCKCLKAAEGKKAKPGGVTHTKVVPDECHHQQGPSHSKPHLACEPMDKHKQKFNDGESSKSHEEKRSSYISGSLDSHAKSNIPKEIERSLTDDRSQVIPLSFQQPSLEKAENRKQQDPYGQKKLEEHNQPLETKEERNEKEDHVVLADSQQSGSQALCDIGDSSSHSYSKETYEEATSEESPPCDAVLVLPPKTTIPPGRPPGGAHPHAHSTLNGSTTTFPQLLEPSQPEHSDAAEPHADFPSHEVTAKPGAMFIPGTSPNTTPAAEPNYFHSPATSNPFIEVETPSLSETTSKLFQSLAADEQPPTVLEDQSLEDSIPDGLPDSTTAIEFPLSVDEAGASHPSMLVTGQQQCTSIIPCETAGSQAHESEDTTSYNMTSGVMTQLLLRCQLPVEICATYPPTRGCRLPILVGMCARSGCLRLLLEVLITLVQCRRICQEHGVAFTAVPQAISIDPVSCTVLLHPVCFSLSQSSEALLFTVIECVKTFESLWLQLLPVANYSWDASEMVQRFMCEVNEYYLIAGDREIMDWLLEVLQRILCIHP